MIEIVAFFVACMAVLALSWLTRAAYGRADAIALSVCLCGSWLVSKMIAHHGDLWLTFSTVGDWKTARQAYPAIDAVIVTIAMLLCVEKTELWKIGLISTIVAKLGVDLIYAFAGLGTETTDGNAYQLIMNVAFGFELAFVSWPGGWAVANHYRGLGLFDRFGRPGRLPSRADAAKVAR